MASGFANLIVKVGAETTEFVTGINLSQKKLNKFARDIDANAEKFAKYTAAAAAAGAAITAAFVTRGLEAIDAQAKLAQSLNTTSTSLANIKRAGELSGVAMSGIEQATKDLTRRLSQAADGTGPAVAALNRLGLSARELMAMPLDQRVSTINQAISDFIPRAQQAAVAGQLFGEEGSIAMSRISPDTIKQAADEVRLFGVAVSDVDAKKVEAANDAFSTFGLAMEGIQNQLAVEFAPILKAISMEFVNAAKEAGGMSNLVGNGFNKVIDAAGFVMDAVEGVKRVFQGVGKGIADLAILGALDFNKLALAIIEGPTNAINALIKAINDLTGSSIQPVGEALTQDLKTRIEELAAAHQIAITDIVDTITAPLPSENLRKWVDDAKAMAQEVAVAQVEAQQNAQAMVGDGGFKTRLDMKEEEDKAWLEANRWFNEQLLADDQATIARRIAAQQAGMDALSNLTTLMNSKNKQMFEIGKKAAIAETIIQTYLGAQKIFSALAHLGPWVAGAGAATAVAAGMARVSAIKSQSFGGGGGGVGGGMSNTQSVSAAAQPVQAQSPVGGTLTVQGLSATSLFTGDAVSALAQELLEYQRRGGNVVLQS